LLWRRARLPHRPALRKQGKALISSQAQRWCSIAAVEVQQRRPVLLLCFMRDAQAAGKA
jgi:hypothetical protein